MGEIIVAVALAIFIFYLLKINNEELEEIKRRKQILEEKERLLRKIKRTENTQIQTVPKNDTIGVSLIKEDVDDNSDNVTFDELERRLTQYVPGEYTTEDE